MIVADSSVWIDHLRRSPTPAVGRLRDLVLVAPEMLVVGDLILLEVLQGARDDLVARQIERDLKVFDVVPMLDPDLAVEAARNDRILRRAGVSIRKLNDMIIGTFCIAHGHALLHDDRDFQPMAEHLGLRLA